MSKIEYLQEQRREPNGWRNRDGRSNRPKASVIRSRVPTGNQDAGGERAAAGTACHPLATENAEDGDAGLNQELPVANKKAAELI